MTLIESYEMRHSRIKISLTSRLSLATCFPEHYELSSTFEITVYVCPCHPKTSSPFSHRSMRTEWGRRSFHPERRVSERPLISTCFDNNDNHNTKKRVNMVDETAATSAEKKEEIPVKEEEATTEADKNAPPSLPPPLKGLVVLPPRQKEPSANEACLGLPPLRPEEPVQSIRLALSEVVGYAHITNYRLELEEGGGLRCRVFDRSERVAALVWWGHQ